MLLVVGELDRNVDPASTMQVVSALIRADKPFELLVVPGAGHGAAETPYGNKRRREFLWKHLLQSSSHRAQVVEDAKIEAENAKDHHDQQSGDQQPDKDARQDR